jgi:hypothetical protein
MADEGIYVVVSIADNGVVHAWGNGPVVNGEVTPFATRTEARQACDRFKRKEKARLDQPDEKGTTFFRVCKVLGMDPVEVKRIG